MRDRRTVSSIFLLLCCSATFPLRGWTNDRLAPSHAPRLLGDFSIGKEGRPILLPVAIDGKEFLFMLDTGACRCAFDSRLRNQLGKPLGRRLLQTPAGQSPVETYEWADATIHGSPLKSDEFVICVDLTQLREVTNEPIYGLIGMDVLRSCRLQIDFDRGYARFVDSLPPSPDDLGVRIPIEISSEGTPCLAGSLPTGASEQFLIDTGAQGNSLRTTLFDQLHRKGHIASGGTYASVTINGEVRGSRGYLERLDVGPILHAGLRMARLNPSSLGLRYLSRFLVTLDFPGHAIYLREGAHFSKPEPRASSGMALLWIGGKVTVDSVKENGPAAKAGIQANDVIVSINGESASEYDHFSLRHLLTAEGGKRVPMRVLRNGREIDVEINLESD